MSSNRKGPVLGGIYMKKRIGLIIAALAVSAALAVTSCDLFQKVSEEGGKSSQAQSETSSSISIDDTSETSSEESSLPEESEVSSQPEESEDTSSDSEESNSSSSSKPSESKVLEGTISDITSISIVVKTADGKEYHMDQTYCEIENEGNKIRLNSPIKVTYTGTLTDTDEVQDVHVEKMWIGIP